MLQIQRLRREWIFRRRLLGLQLLKYGAFLITILGADIVFGAKYQSPDSSVKVHVGTTQGLPSLAVNGAYAIGVFLVFFGSGLLIRERTRDIKDKRRLSVTHN